MDVGGKRVLLTGATGGLGEATAQALAEHGATLLLSGRSEQQLLALAAALPGEGHECFAADLAVPGASRKLIERAGAFDILIANAGLSAKELPHEDDETIEAVVRVNLISPLELVNATIPPMEQQGSGQIVLIASLAGKASMSDLYSTTKAGLRAIGWSLRPRLARSGIVVTLISPGFIAEAGMFARQNRRTLPGFGAVPLDHYAKRLIRAIERGRAEAVIAPPLMRFACQIAVLWPGVIARAVGVRSGRAPAPAN